MVTATRSKPRTDNAVSKQTIHDAMYFIPKAHDPNFVSYKHPSRNLQPQMVICRHVNDAMPSVLLTEPFPSILR